MKLVSAAILATAALASTQALAQDNINPWKHCGIGAMIFDDNGTAAAISNIIWDLGTTAVSSKVTSEDSCEGKRIQTAMFIQKSFNNVLEETAKGEGEYVTAMLGMMDCREEDFTAILSNVRIDVADQVAQPSYQGLSVSAKSEAYYTALTANAATCGA
ncbi:MULTISPECIES: DUF3015 family protein [Marinomonas]|uniref:DUF3015 family protein n=1 Tax=Marinomonas TaxID=28253 RepID=UPI000836E674|nr:MULTISPECIES: DUF3015 family protein [Marinomonas]MCO4785738.1 DUF3015 family protein [Marinomonas atlantica]